MKNNSNQPSEPVIVPDIAFGSLLSKLMSRIGLTQTNLATLAGTTQPTISSLCTGRRQCGVTLASRLSVHLHLTDAERANFIRHATKPRWKGFDHDLYGGEALLYDVLLKTLRAAGIDPSKIESATELPSADAKQPNAILVLKDGSVYDLLLVAQPRPGQSLPSLPAFSALSSVPMPTPSPTPTSQKSSVTDSSQLAEAAPQSQPENHSGQLLQSETPTDKPNPPAEAEPAPAPVPGPLPEPTDESGSASPPPPPPTTPTTPEAEPKEVLPEGDRSGL